MERAPRCHSCCPTVPVPMNIKTFLGLTETVSRIRVGFNADPDPSFYLKADLGPGQPSQKVEFFNLKVYIKRTQKSKHPFFERPVPGNLGQFPCSWIRTHIPNKNLDP
jgi:hypothetical protein